MLWPERHRYRADTLWSDSPTAPLLATVRDHFLRAPSPKSLAVCVLATGPEHAATLPDAAFSMAPRTAFLGYAIWERPEDDAANRAWHREMMSALDAFAVGHYVGESDIVAQPSRAERSFAPANWRRLDVATTEIRSGWSLSRTVRSGIAVSAFSQRSSSRGASIRSAHAGNAGVAPHHLAQCARLPAVATMGHILSSPRNRR